MNKKEIIFSHEEGLEKVNYFKKKYDTEIEILCLNSSFFNIDKELINAMELASQFTEQCVLKESEFHEEELPYYEISFFCNKNDVNKSVKLIESFNLKIDIIHEKS